MASSVSISDLTAKLQENVKDNPNIFTRKLVTSINNLGIWTVYDDVEDQIDLTQMITGDPLQPGNRATSWAPKTGVHQFKDRIGVVKHAESAQTFKQAQIEALWKSHLAKKRSSTRQNIYDMPFADLMQQRTVSASIDALVKKTLFKGSLNATGTTASDICDGINTIISADVTSTDIPAANVFAGAAITKSNAEAQFNGVKDLVISQNPEYIDEELVCLAAPENVVHYWTNYQSNHGALPYNTQFEQMTLEGINCRIVKEIGLVGSDRIIITTPGNLALMTNSLSNIDEIEYWKEHWDLDMGLKFKIGVDYHIAELMFVNDQS